MPESKGRPAKSDDRPRKGNPAARAAEDAEREARLGSAARRRTSQKVTVGNPRWFVPVMLGFMLLGLLWIVTFYITNQTYPVESLGRWNLAVGFALMMVGFLMTTRWR